MLYGTWPVRWETGRRGNRTHRCRERLRGVQGAGGELKAQIPRALSLRGKAWWSS